MTDIYEDIRAWLLQQQDWLQEAAERLLSKQNLDETDIDELCDLVSSKAGRQITKHRAFESLVSSTGSEAPVHLVSVGNVTDIDNLSPKSALTFGSGNLSVVYGHNGSGKSSYTRILKKASGKPRANVLRPNVFDLSAQPQKCDITYRVGDQEFGQEWKASDHRIDHIASMDIFDGDEAGHYLRSETAVAYNPPIIAFFENLAVACESIKTRLQARKGLLVSQLPPIAHQYQQTAVARRYGSLTASLSSTEIQAITQWKPEHEEELKQLEERLKVQDPATLAASKRNTMQQVSQLIADIKRYTAAYGAEGVGRIRSSRDVAAEKRRIAEEGSQLTDSKLEGIGSQTWRAMWQAARQYSGQVYPGADFPNVGENARCVLCQQELDQDSKSRFVEFERYVKGQLEATAKQAETEYTNLISRLPPDLSQEVVNTKCQAAGLDRPDWKAALWSFWQIAGANRLCLAQGESNGACSVLPDQTQNLEALGNFRSGLEREALQLEKDAQEFDRAEASRKKLEFEAHRWVTAQATAVIAEVSRLKAVEALDACVSATNSRRVSVKAGEIAGRVITEAYVARFNTELTKLNARHIRVELVKTRTTRGQVHHKLKLVGAIQGDSDPASVLSEGERRIISLAAFLADVVERPQIVPFVFDDPISSLDQDYEWAVAVRLGELAESRQVIVFTHRLSLYGAMQDVASKKGGNWKKDHYYSLCIESYSGTAGHPADMATWNANTRSANNILITRLLQAKSAGEAGGGEAYRALAQGICSDFRKLLERSVEEDLLNSVVIRHRRGVTTDNRLPHLADIRPEDCALIDGLMTKYSCYEHSQSFEAPVFIPEEPELADDLNTLKQWRAELVARRKP